MVRNIVKTVDHLSVPISLAEEHCMTGLVWLEFWVRQLLAGSNLDPRLRKSTAWGYSKSLRIETWVILWPAIRPRHQLFHLPSDSDRTEVIAAQYKHRSPRSLSTFLQPSGTGAQSHDHKYKSFLTLPLPGPPPSLPRPLPRLGCALTATLATRRRSLWHTAHRARPSAPRLPQRPLLPLPTHATLHRLLSKVPRQSSSMFVPSLHRHLASIEKATPCTGAATFSPCCSLQHDPHCFFCLVSLSLSSPLL